MKCRKRRNSKPLKLINKEPFSVGSRKCYEEMLHSTQAERYLHKYAEGSKSYKPEGKLHHCKKYCPIFVNSL